MKLGYTATRSVRARLLLSQHPTSGRCRLEIGSIGRCDAVIGPMLFQIGYTSDLMRLDVGQPISARCVNADVISDRLRSIQIGLKSANRHRITDRLCIGFQIGLNSPNRNRIPDRLEVC
ncbi:Uncharacterised protein r2_g72 [Pycnogonum litorale]